MPTAAIFVLRLAALSLLFIWLYPSWVYVSQDPVFGFRGTIGSQWIWDPPMPYGVSLDYPKQILFSAVVILVALGLILWSRHVRRGPA
ncbi:MAG: hypothetical protein ACUVXD_09585 [Thermodesulfobacteriota bacterium]